MSTYHDSAATNLKEAIEESNEYTPVDIDRLTDRRIAIATAQALLAMHETIAYPHRKAPKSVTVDNFSARDADAVFESLRKSNIRVEALNSKPKRAATTFAKKNEVFQAIQRKDGNEAEVAKFINDLGFKAVLDADGGGIGWVDAQNEYTEINEGEWVTKPHHARLRTESDSWFRDNCIGVTPDEK